MSPYRLINVQENKHVQSCFGIQNPLSLINRSETSNYVSFNLRRGFCIYTTRLDDSETIRCIATNLHAHINVRPRLDNLTASRSNFLSYNVQIRIR